MRGLQESGLHVDVVPDGATALTSLRPQHLLVIVDDEVGMDPVELCRMLRSRSEVPVIVITSGDHEERVVGALEAGAGGKRYRGR